MLWMNSLHAAGCECVAMHERTSECAYTLHALGLDCIMIEAVKQTFQVLDPRASATAHIAESNTACSQACMQMLCVIGSSHVEYSDGAIPV